jgi:hypothetical protein
MVGLSALMKEKRFPMDNQIVRHVLVCKFSKAMSAETFEGLIREFRGLATKIPGILAFEYGANHSPEGIDQGMTHVITLTFADAAARDVYLPHPEHRRFVEYMGGLQVLESILVVDYTPQP